MHVMHYLEFVDVEIGTYLCEHVHCTYIKLEVFSEEIPCTVLWYYCGTKWH